MLSADASLESAKSRLSGVTKLLYGLGEIAITTKMALFGLFVLLFYTSVMGLPAIWVGIATASGLAWDAVIDPYIGYRSDTSESRYGRRHPFMICGALTMGACFWMIWAPPRSLSAVGLFFWLLTAMLLFRTTSALFRIPYLSMGAELSDDYHERTSIVGVRSFFGLVGSLAAASLSLYFFFPNTTPGVDPKLSYEGYPRMGLVFGVVITLSAVIAILGTLSHREKQLTRQGPKPSFASFLTGFRLALESRSFRKIWLSFSLFFVAVILNGSIAIHFLTWYVEIHDSTVLSGLQVAFYVSALMGVGFWVVLSRKGEKLHLFVGAMVATSALMGSAPIVFGEGSIFGTGDPRPVFALTALAGFFASALWVLPASMIADVADEDELDTGLRREGLLFGILNFGEKIAAGLAVLIGGALMDYFVRLVPSEASQSAEAVSRIGIIFGVAPAGILILAVCALYGYRLNRDTLTSIQRRLLERGTKPLT